MNYLTTLPDNIARQMFPINFEFALKGRKVPTKFFGFWRSFKEEQNPLPWPGDYCDSIMGLDEREQVASLLDFKPIIFKYLGFSWDRLGSSDSIGNEERFCYPYQWPSGLSHYVRQYGLRIDPNILSELRT